MIRRTTSDDALAISDLFARTRDEMTYLPRIPDAVRPLLGGQFLERAELWVVEENEQVVGFAGVSGSELTHLYIDPSAQKRGLGSALLDHVKNRAPSASNFGCSRRTKVRGGSTNGTASSSSGSPMGRRTCLRVAPGTCRLT